MNWGFVDLPCHRGHLTIECGWLNLSESCIVLAVKFAQPISSTEDV